MPPLPRFWFCHCMFNYCCCCCCYYCNFSLFFSLSIRRDRRVGFWPDWLSAASAFEELFCADALFPAFPLPLPFCYPLDYGVFMFRPFCVAWFFMLTMFVSDDERLEFICSCLPSLLGVMSRLTEPLTLLPPPLELSLSCRLRLLPSLVSRLRLCIS